MALVLHLEKRKMGASAKKWFQEADLGTRLILIPAMVLVEISYLSEKSRINTTVADVEKHLKKHTSYKLIDLNVDIIKKSFEILDIPELHDRLIAGTSHYFKLPLITNDTIISQSKYLSCIWK